MESSDLLGSPCLRVQDAIEALSIAPRGDLGHDRRATQPDARFPSDETAAAVRTRRNTKQRSIP